MKTCLDCGKKISYKAKRCQSCALVYNHKIGKINSKGKNNPMFGNPREDLKIKFKGKGNPRYINGKSYNNKCITCGKHIGFSAKKCRSCANIKNGDYIKKHYCINCGKIISIGTFKYGKGQCKNCYCKTLKGKNHPNWIDGRSYKKYPKKFSYKLKNKIRKRDNYICQKCGLKERKSFRKLDIHHIDYNRNNCNKNNLITLCLKCNIKVNSNRSYWYTYFTNIIGENKNGK